MPIIIGVDAEPAYVFETLDFTFYPGWGTSWDGTAVRIAYFQGRGNGMQAARQLFIFCVIFSGLTALARALPQGEAPRRWSARATEVSDGDSFRARRGNRVARVRLYGIDSPELAQAYGDEARKVARSLMTGRELRVEPLYRDSYNRDVALVYAGDTLVNLELVRGGAAWVYTRYCTEKRICARLKEAETAARAARSGLWRERNPEPPWQWRRKHPQTGRR